MKLIWVFDSHYGPKESGSFGVEMRTFNVDKTLDEQVLITAIGAKQKNPKFFIDKKVKIALMEEDYTNGLPETKILKIGILDLEKGTIEYST